MRDEVPDLLDYSPNVLVVDLDAVSHNIREIRRVIGAGRKLFAVLKGNAYGFGAVPIGKAVLEAGADALSVVHLRDAIQLRKAGIQAPILLYGGDLGDPGTIPLVESYGLTTTLVDLKSARLYSRESKNRIRVLVKVDVGLERLGVSPEDSVSLIREILTLPRLDFGGVYTHMSIGATYESSHEPQDRAAAYLDWQYRRFQRVLGDLRNEGIHADIAMAASSPALYLSQDRMGLTAVDPGRLIYGITPYGFHTLRWNLRPAFRSLKSRLIQTKSVRRSEFLEELGFAIRDHMRIGVAPIGLAEGANFLTCGEVLVRARRARVLGVFLEHMRIDLTDIHDAEAGDEVVLVGAQRDAEISIEEVLRHQNLSPSAGLGSLVRESVKRLYLSVQGSPSANPLDSRRMK